VADYRVVRVLRLPDRCTNDRLHPRELTTGSNPSTRGRGWTVSQTRDAIVGGDTFHTIGRETGRRSEVEAFICECGEASVQSMAANEDGLDGVAHRHWLAWLSSRRS
jgi:hypothetical protein